MGLFRKNKDKDEEKDDTRKIKDLSPKNKNKRKEPKLPWGKKERVFVFFVLLLTSGGSAFLGLSSRGWKLPGYPKITIPKMSWEETYIFENDEDGPPLLFDSSEVVEDFRDLTDNLTGIYGFYVVRLNTGESYGYNQSEIFQAASLIKLPVMTLAYLPQLNGMLDLSSAYRLKESDKIGGSGSLQNQKADTLYTYDELLELLGQESDNTAMNAISQEIGEDRINSFMKEIGMRRTSLEENETTPKEIGTLFARLWKGDLIERDNSKKIFEYLTETIYEEHLPRGVPEDIVVAHKYGREVNVVNDAGIVFVADPYVVVIMSKNVKMAEADEIFPTLSRLIYKFEVN